jgi:hypothetical protein
MHPLKAAAFPDEGGPVILVLDVPDEIVARAVDEVYLPLSQGVVQFDEGAGLEELKSAVARRRQRDHSRGAVMSTSPRPVDVVRGILSRPAGGVVGLVDELLTACHAHSLTLDWQADRCRVLSATGGPEETLIEPLRKSLFRTVLARLATVCNERGSGPVSQYGGDAEVVAAVGGPGRCRVVFVNTADDQRLSLSPVAHGAVVAVRRS